jgi:hypothetical protein
MLDTYGRGQIGQRPFQRAMKPTLLAAPSLPSDRASQSLP